MNDPYRMIGIFGMVLLTRLPLLLSGEHLTVPELNWMLVGERLADGHRLYVGVWDNIGPLSALVYQIIDFFFDRSRTAYILLAALLTTYQSLVFNNFLLNKKAYNENTYIPALVYILVSCFSFDFYTLSPVLLSLTWILMAMRNVFYRIESHSRDARILGTGIYIGIAALFYLPASIYLVSTFISYLLFASVSPRRYLLLLHGFALPFLLAFTYFFFFDALNPFIHQYLISFRYIESRHYISLLAAGIISIVPLIFLFISLYQLGQYRRFTNQQSKLQQIMLIKLIAAVITVLFVKERAPYHLLLLLPPVAFFITHYLLMIQRIWLAEIVTAVFALLVVLNGYAFLFGFFSLHKAAGISDLFTQPTAYDEVVAGKKTLLLGDDLNIYRNSKLATPYLNWQLASRQLKEMGYFENLSQIYINFSKDMPEVIIDEAQLMPQLIERIPALKQSYQQVRQDIYVKQ